MSASVATAGERTVRWTPVAAIVHREWRVFRRVWLSLMFGSVVEPLIYLLAFGYGFGALVAEVRGIPYLDFMATGAAGIAVLFTGFFPGLINGFFRRTQNGLYDGLLSTPTSVAEIVTGEVTWTGFRTAGTACITLAVAALFGVPLSWTVVLVPLIAWVGGVGFAALGGAFAAILRNTHQFDFVIAGIVVPMFVVAGAFFPVEDGPVWLRLPAQANPLTHLVELLRWAAFGTGTPVEVGLGVVALVATVGLAWWLNVRWLTRSLID